MRTNNGRAASRLSIRLATVLPWSILQTALGFFLSFASVLVTGRLIYPSELGQAALAMAVVTSFQILFSLGLVEAFTKERSGHTEIQDGVFWVALGSGVIACALCVAISSPIQALYPNSQIAELSAAYAPNCVLQAIAIVPMAALVRKMRARKLLFHSLYSKVTIVVVTWLTAWYGYGAWSLILGSLAGTSAGAVFLWKQHPRAPRLRCSLSAVKPLLSFGALLSVEMTLWNVTTRVFLLLVGYFHGMVALGLFTFSLRIVEEISNALHTAVGKFILPLLSTVQRSGQTLVGPFLKGSTLAATCFVAPMVGLACIATDLFALLFPDRWSGAVRVFQILSLLWATSLARMLVPIYLRLTGLQAVNLIISILCISVSLLAVLLTTGLGVAAVALAYASRVFVALPLGVLLVARFGGVPLRDQLSAFLGPAIASAGMAGCVIITQNTLAHAPLLVRLSTSVSIGALLYVVVLFIIDRRAFQLLARTVATVSSHK